MDQRSEVRGMTSPRVCEPDLELGPPISRNEIVTRARSWLRPEVAYGHAEFHDNEFGRYRRDCAGYVSMAWGLPERPFDTAGLVALSVRIAKRELRAGDILARVDGARFNRHVAIFCGWADNTRDAYWGFELVGGIETVYRIIGYPYDKTADYQPFRYLNATD
jgi:hypothetical protein